MDPWFHFHLGENVLCTLALLFAVALLGLVFFRDDSRGGLHTSYSHARCDGVGRGRLPPVMEVDVR